MNVQVDPSATSSLWKSLGIAGIVVFAIWLLSWLIIDYSIVDITERGTFGDKFGAVNALFSGLAFAGLIVTLLYQKRNADKAQPQQCQSINLVPDHLKTKQKNLLTINRGKLLLNYKDLRRK